jgi:hypothetical protein
MTIGLRVYDRRVQSGFWYSGLFGLAVEMIMRHQLNGGRPCPLMKLAPGEPRVDPVRALRYE